MAVQTSRAGAAKLASFLGNIRYEDVPEPVLKAARYHLLDVIGCGLAALGLDEGTAGVAVAKASAGAAEATVIGVAERLPAPQAALANGMLMHALDFDDTHERSIAHVSTVVAPAAMAQAEALGASGRELLIALVTGNEIVARIGMAAPGMFHARGFHPTSVAGVFGATAAAARLAGAPEAVATNALGIAGSMSSGLFAYLDAGTPTKPVHAGWSAQAGLVAVRLAQAGAEGPATILEGRFGVFEAFTGQVPDLAPELDDLGSRWETPNIAFKAYPACHYIHGALGAAAQLEPVDPDDIADILVTVPDGAVALVLEPLALKLAPRSSYDARFSLPYSLAALLVNRRVHVGTYLPDAILDPAVLAVASRVRYAVREFPSYPGAFPGAVEITLRDGRMVSAELAHQPGAAANPMLAAEIEAKFTDNASLTLDAPEVAELKHLILGLDEVAGVARVFGRLAGARRAPLTRASAVEPNEIAAPQPIDIAAMAASHETGSSEILTTVNGSVVKFGVTDSASHWHSHDDEDSFFLVLDGRLSIDLEGGQAIELGPHHAVTIPKGVVHRPRADVRTAVLMVVRPPAQTSGPRLREEEET